MVLCPRRRAAALPPPGEFLELYNQATIEADGTASIHAEFSELADLKGFFATFANARAAVQVKKGGERRHCYVMNSDL